MTCEHTHKDAPENAVCEDCFRLDYTKEALKHPKSYLIVTHTQESLVYKEFYDLDEAILYLKELRGLNE